MGALCRLTRAEESKGEGLLWVLGAGSLGVSQIMLIWTLRAGSAAVSADVAKLNSPELQPWPWHAVSSGLISTGWQVGKEIPALGWQSVRKPWRTPQAQALPLLVFSVQPDTS